MSYIGQTLPADTFQGFTTDSFAGDGSATTFTLSKTPFNESALLVVINNVVQKPTTNFTVSGTTLTIVGTAVASGDVIYATHIGGALPIGQAASLDLNGASDQLILDADADTTISADTDDQIDFKLGGTDFMSLTTTGATITTADNLDTLSLISTDADANVGPVLRLFRNSASPADNDVIGNIVFSGEDDAGNETDFLTFQVNAGDVANGAEDGFMRIMMPVASTSTEFMRMSAGGLVFNEGGVDMDFRVESNNLDDALFVDASTDRVGIGTQTPQDTLDVTSAGDTQVIIRCAGTSNDSYLSFRAATDLHWYIKANFNSGVETLEFIDYAEGSNNVRMTLAVNGEISGNFNDTSDISLKKEVTTLPSSDFVKNLNPVSFKWKEDDREAKGFIAQEVAALDSSLVSGEDGRKAINVTGIVAQLTKSLQEAMAKIETLETKVKALEDA